MSSLLREQFTSWKVRIDSFTSDLGYQRQEENHRCAEHLGCVYTDMRSMKID